MMSVSRFQSLKRPARRRQSFPQADPRRSGFSGLGLSCLLTALGLALSACSSAPPTTYDLSALRPGNARPASLRGQLIVYEPDAIALYDSDRLVVNGNSQGMTYLPGSQWTDRLPKLVQTRMIQSFENANRYKSVGRPGDHISANSVLTSEIRAFQIDEASRQAIVEISVKLVSQGSGTIESGQLFRATAPVASIDGAGASAALDLALQNALSQLIGWSARR